MNLQTFQNINTNLTVLDDAYSTVSFTLPTEHIRSFMFMFQSMAALMQGLTWKAKTDIKLIHLKNEKNQRAVDERLEAYQKAVTENYLTYIEQGFTPRVSLSLTVSAVVEEFQFSSYDNVKNLLIKNKLLKNTGFYKSRHKY